MNYIITNEQYYKDIGNSIRERLKVDREYYPKDMANAIHLIPSSADGSNELVSGYYFYAPNENGYATKCKAVGLPQTTLIKLNDNISNTFGDIYDFIEYIYFADSCNIVDLEQSNLPRGNPNLKEIRLSSNIQEIGFRAIFNYQNLTTLNIPKSLKKIYPKMHIEMCPNLEFVRIEEGFDCDELNISCSTKYSRETIVSGLKALKDRSGITNEATYKFIIGPKNLKKLIAEDIAIATSKNWTIA